MRYQYQVVTILVICFLTIGLPPAFLEAAIEDSQKQSDDKLASYAQVSYCDLLQHPKEYDGKQVAMRASYRYFFEVSEMFCLKCRDKGKTWLEYSFDNAKTVNRALRNTPDHQGIINAVFYGTFRGTEGGYGDGGYLYKFDLEFVKDVKVVYRDGRDPELLPANVKKKVCQE